MLANHFMLLVPPCLSIFFTVGDFRCLPGGDSGEQFDSQHDPGLDAVVRIGDGVVVGQSPQTDPQSAPSLCWNMGVMPCL